LKTNEGRAAWVEAIEEIRKAKPISALAWSDGLALAAHDHCNDSGPKGRTGHYGSDGSDPF
jgi:uncharacterized protein YkwD